MATINDHAACGVVIDGLRNRLTAAEARCGALERALEPILRWLALNEEVHNGPDHQPLSYPTTYGEMRKLKALVDATPTAAAERVARLEELLAADRAWDAESAQYPPGHPSRTQAAARRQRALDALTTGGKA